MNTKLALFSHHYVSDIIVHRFNNLKRLNPDWDVKPIGFEGYDLLPDSIITNREKYPDNLRLLNLHGGHHVDWFSPDLYLYDAYLKFPEYDSYFLYEYDTICNTPIDSFFDINLDFFGNNILDPADENWEWIQRYRLSNDCHNHFKILYSYGQSTCIYFKNHILSKCVNELLTNKHLYNNMFCEIRGGVLTKQFTTLKKGRHDIEKYISWTPNDINVDLTKPHFYHPVK
jgi:hypothetical protein